MNPGPQRVGPVQGLLFDEPPRRTAEELAGELRRRSGRPVALTLTRNRSHLVSLAGPAGPGPVRVRLHETFLQAPADVIQCLGRYLRTSRRSDWDVVEQFAQQPAAAAATAPARPPRLSTRGRVHNLDELSRAVNQNYFQGRLRCRVGWSPARRRRGRKRRSSIRYGSYQRDTDTIRIHALLDDPRVPRAFLEYIIFHEMLHAVVPPERRGGRWLYHPPLFRHLERRFPDWHRMQRLSRDLLDRLD